MQPTQAVLTMMPVWAAVLHQSAPAPLRHIRSPPNSQVDERPSQNCSSIATDYPILAWRLFLSSVKQKNFTLPVGVHHETRSVSWERHSTVQNGKHRISKYTKCRDTSYVLRGAQQTQTPRTGNWRTTSSAQAVRRSGNGSLGWTVSSRKWGSCGEKGGATVGGGGDTVGGGGATVGGGGATAGEVRPPHN